MEKKEEKKKENCCGRDGTGKTDGIEGSIRGPRWPKNARSCVKLAPLRASVNLATLSLFCWSTPSGWARRAINQKSGLWGPKFSCMIYWQWEWLTQFGKSPMGVIWVNIEGGVFSALQGGQAPEVTAGTCQLVRRTIGNLHRIIFCTFCRRSGSKWEGANICEHWTILNVLLCLRQEQGDQASSKIHQFCNSMMCDGVSKRMLTKCYNVITNIV